MFSLLTSALLLNPADIVEWSIPPASFPAARKSWDRIGLFDLKDGNQRRLMVLYHYDSDSVARKIIERKGVASSFYPNIFEVHALYQTASGKWIHKKVLAYARVHFINVVKVTHEEVRLQCRPCFSIDISVQGGRVTGKAIEEAMKKDKEINQPFVKVVSFVDGQLIARDAPAADKPSGGQPKEQRNRKP